MAMTQRNFRMADEDYEALEKLADVQGVTTADALRSLVPGTGPRSVFGFLKASGATGAPHFRAWLEELAAAELRRQMSEDIEYPLDASFLPQPGTDPRRTFMRYAEWAAARDAIWYPDGRTRGQFETAMGGMPLDVSLVRNPATGRYGLLRSDQQYNADGGIEQAAPRRAKR